MNRTYRQALAKANEASRKFLAAKEAYRARKISSEAYAAAFKAHQEASIEYDRAYALCGFARAERRPPLSYRN
jgi:hypothetical protein